MRSRSLVALGAFVLIRTSQLPAQDQRTALLAADRAAAQLSNDSGFAAALRRNTSREAVLLWPGAPVAAGTENIGRLVDSLPTRDSLRLVWQPLGLELSKDSTMGVTWGIAVTTPRSAGAAPRIGRYTTIWRRANGNWTIAAALINGVPPLPTTALPQGMPISQRPVRAAGTAAPLVEADLAFARLAGERGAAVAFRQWAAPEAFTLGGGGLITRGPEAIGSAVDGPAVWRWHPVAAGASQTGDLGWTVGEAVIAPQDGDPEYGKYLTVWVRTAGGAPRFLTDGGNPRPPAP